LHLLGESVAALEILRQAKDDCHQFGLQAQIPKMYMLEANIHLAMGDYHQTLRDIDQCVAGMRKFGGYSLQLDAYIGRFRGMALWYLGDKTEGLRLLKAAQEPAKQFGVLTAMEVALLHEYFGLLDGYPLRQTSNDDLPFRHQSSECYLIFLTLQGMRAHRTRDLLRLRRSATAICDMARKYELPQWVATGSFLLAMSVNHSKDRKRQLALLKSGLSHLKQIGWRSFPMRNDSLTSFIIAKSIRFGIDIGLVEPLLSTGSDIDLTPAFISELEDCKLTEEESIRLWDAAGLLAVRGLAQQLKKHTASATRKKLAALNTYREFLDSNALPPLRIEMLGGFTVRTRGR
jgi:hypothetical protein